MDENRKNEIYKVYEDFTNEFEKIAAASRNEKISGLLPGDALPEEHRVYGEKRREEFKQAVAKYKEKAEEILDKIQAEVWDKMAAAPSDDGIKAVKMLSYTAPSEKIENIAERERFTTRIDAIMNKYGDNYSVYEALKHFAEVAGDYGFKDHQVTKDMAACEVIRNLINSYFTTSPINNGISNLDKVSFKKSIDNAGKSIFLAQPVKTNW